MTPPKPKVSERPWWADMLFKNKEMVVIICVIFAPEVKEVITHYTGIHFSQDAAASTMILQKLDALSAKVDTIGQTGTNNSNRLDNLESTIYQPVYGPHQSHFHPNQTMASNWHPRR